MKSFKQKFQEFVEDSECSLSLDLLYWKLNFKVGKDRENDCTQMWWCFVSVGPIHLKLAPSHWDQW